MATCTPVVDECGDEVDAWFVGHNEAFLKATTHAQAVGSKLLQVGASLLVKSYIDLFQTLHVVYIHTHHVTQAVRQEHGVSAGCYSLVHIALHQAKLLEALGHEAAHCKVYIFIFHAGSCNLQCQVVALLDDAVDFELAL